MEIGSDKLETVHLGAGEWPFLKRRDDGLTESSYYVFEGLGMFGGRVWHTVRPPAPAPLPFWQQLMAVLFGGRAARRLWPRSPPVSLRQRLLTWAGVMRWVPCADGTDWPLFEPEKPRPPPRRPGQLWHGFSAAGGPISEVVLRGGGSTLWTTLYDPPVDSISHIRPFGLTLPAFLLAYHDLVLTFVHAPGSTVTVVERWTTPFESREAFLASDEHAAEFGTWRAPSTPDGGATVVIMSGMIALGGQPPGPGPRGSARTDRGPTRPAGPGARAPRPRPGPSAGSG